MRLKKDVVQRFGGDRPKTGNLFHGACYVASLELMKTLGIVMILSRSSLYSMAQWQIYE